MWHRHHENLLSRLQDTRSPQAQTHSGHPFRSFQVFGPALLLTSGGPVKATEILTLLLYRSAFLYFRMGYSTAIAVAMFVILIVFSLLQFRISKRRQA